MIWFIAGAVVALLVLYLLLSFFERRSHHPRLFIIDAQGANVTAINLDTTQKETGLGVVALDAAGNPVPVVGVPVWTSDNPAVATVTAAADGLTAEVDSVTVGTCNVSVAVTDTNGNVVTSAPAVVTVVAAAIASVEITAGTVVSK